jgi:hypothetical protein
MALSAGRASQQRGRRAKAVVVGKVMGKVGTLTYRLIGPAENDHGSFFFGHFRLLAPPRALSSLFRLSSHPD